MRLLSVSSELAPLAKTGGLADVCAALPAQLQSLGHESLLVLPRYAELNATARAIRPVDGLGNLSIELGGRTIPFQVFTTELPRSAQLVHLIDAPTFFARPGIYTQDPDEGPRFVFLCHAALVLCQRLGFAPQIVHGHDWQGALLPLLLRTSYAWDDRLNGAKSVLTIHNLAYQGLMPAEFAARLGLPGDSLHLLHQDDLRTGRINLLLTGLLYADLITTVSPTYAREIQTEGYGCGLDAVLRARSRDLVGILNGVDDDWDPATDPLITARYDRDTLELKRINRDALLARVGLAPTTAAPVLGVVSRLTGQKGFDLMFGTLPRALALADLRLVVLGSGEARYEQFFQQLQRQHPAKVAFLPQFSNELAHAIEAGADIFLMPSRFEPCGLNQMYSLRYGTVPIVRQTGGLADTVIPWNPAAGSGNGFVFEPFSPEAFWGALVAAVHTFEDRSVWRRLQTNGMSVDFSWRHRAQQYLAVFQRLLRQ